SLTNLNQFSGLTNIGGNLDIVLNPSLTNCAATGICNYIAAPNGVISILLNGTGCNSQAQVEVACGLLPVELLEFKAVIMEEGVKLVWSTASEKDNLGYNLEHSIDARHWSAIGFVSGNGTTTQQMNYAYMDEHPMPGVNYYRLKQMDTDGNFEYSSVVIADVKTGGAQFDIFPNPSLNGLFNLRTVSAVEGDAVMEVLNGVGARIFTQEISLDKGTVIYPISLANYPKGAYTARLEMPDGQVLVRKIFIQ
ncbi:MAG: hypothetical protein H6565_00005, partial [Lewinellaceae bacterium]|nr:hypothetical protein [Lewinellaceae bacterium]